MQLDELGELIMQAYCQFSLGTFIIDKIHTASASRTSARCMASIIRFVTQSIMCDEIRIVGLVRDRKKSAKQALFRSKLVAFLAAEQKGQNWML